MNRRVFLHTLGSGLLLASFNSGGRASEKPLTVGIFPRYNITTTHTLFTPMLNYLGKQLGREIQIVTARDFSSFWQALKTQQFDVVHCNQYQYILAHELYGYEALVRNVEFGESTMAGALMVRKDSHFTKITDLRGKKILFGGDKMAMQSYIAATWLLRQAGLKSGDYEELFALNPPNAAISTHMKQADAAGVGDVVIRLDAVKKAIDVSTMTYLAKSEPMPQLPWATHPKLAVAIRKKLQTLFIDMKKDADGQAALDQAGLSGFVITHDKDYASARSMVRGVYGDDMGIAQWK
jgi:phosphonate transport system substrate-binding protein